jgi:hypothetical protein
MGHDPGVDRGGIDEGHDGRAGYRGQVQHRQQWPSGLANVARDVVDGGCGDGTHAGMVVRRRRCSRLFDELSREFDPLEGVDVSGTGVDRRASHGCGLDHRLRGIGMAVGHHEAERFQSNEQPGERRLHVGTC